MERRSTRRGAASGVMLAALALPAGATAAAVSPSLAARLANAPRSAALAILVTLARQVDPAQYTGRPRTLLLAERRLAARTQPQVIETAGRRVRRFWITNALALSARPDAIARLAALRAVARVDLDPTVRAGDLGGPILTTPGAQPQGQVGTAQAVVSGPLQAIGAPAVWRDLGVLGAGVRLGSIDTGVDPANADLAGKIVAWRDFVGNRSAPYDDNGHGTHTIGTMVGGDAGGAPIGVAPGARVVVAKALDATGAGLGSDLIAAAQWMSDPDGDPSTDDFPAAINNSWSAADPNDTWFDQVVRSWVAIGILPVFAAGNSGPAASTVGSPAGYLTSLSVAAVDDTLTVASFSSRGPVIWENRDGTGPVAGTALGKPDLAAPGVGIVSSVGSGYRAYSGTSMAAPHVAGVAALVKTAAPTMGPTEIADLLRRTARDLGPAGPDASYGAGIVDALAAVSAVRATPTPAPAPTAAPAPTTPVPTEPAVPPPAATPPPASPAPEPVASPVVPPALSPPPEPPTAGPAEPPPTTPAPPPAIEPPAAAGTPSVLRDLRVLATDASRRRTLVINGRLLAPARLRAVLRPAGSGARIRGGAAIAVGRSAAIGRFQLRVPVATAQPGRYRLALTPTDPGGRPLGRAATTFVTLPPRGGLR